MTLINIKLNLNIVILAAFINLSLPAGASGDVPDSAAIDTLHKESDVYYKKTPSLGENEDRSIFGYLVRTIVVTTILIAVIIFGAKFYKKYVYQNIGASKSRIRVIARQAIGPKQFVVLVAIDGKKYALGVTDQAVNMLTGLGDLDESEDTGGDVRRPGAFADLLKKVTGERNA